MADPPDHAAERRPVWGSCPDRGGGGVLPAEAAVAAGVHAGVAAVPAGYGWLMESSVERVSQNSKVSRASSRTGHLG